jgi:L-ascorbate metabolism protein UlaG (beta-lactamase superfamily)
VAVVKIRFLGVSAFEIETEDGTRILIDPYITGNPDCPISADEITSADLVIVSHNSWDHLGDAFALAKRTGAALLAGNDVRALAEREGFPRSQILSTQPGATREVGSVRVRATVAHHTSFGSPGKDIYMSASPLGFVITTGDGIRIHHPGDTCLFSDLKLIAELCHPQILMIPVDAVIPTAPKEMSPLDAALATQWIGPDVVIPVHYYPESPNPEEFQKHAETLAPGTRVLLRPKGWFSYEPSRVSFL